MNASNNISKFPDLDNSSKLIDHILDSDDSEELDELPDISSLVPSARAQSRKQYLKNDSSNSSTYRWNIDLLSSTATIDDSVAKRRKLAVQNLLQYDSTQTFQTGDEIDELIGKSVGSNVLNVLRSNPIYDDDLRYEYCSNSKARVPDWNTLKAECLKDNDLEFNEGIIPTTFGDLLSAKLVPLDIALSICSLQFFRSLGDTTCSEWIANLEKIFYSYKSSSNNLNQIVRFIFETTADMIGIDLAKRQVPIQLERTSASENLKSNLKIKVINFLKCCGTLYRFSDDTVRFEMIQDACRILIDNQVGSFCKWQFSQFMELPISLNPDFLISNIHKVSESPRVWVTILSSLSHSCQKFRKKIAFTLFVGKQSKNDDSDFSSLCQRLDEISASCNNDYTTLLYQIRTFGYAVDEKHFKTNERLECLLEKLRKIDLTISGSTDHLLLSRCEVKDCIHRLFMVLYYLNTNSAPELERMIESDLPNNNKQKDRYFKDKTPNLSMKENKSFSAKKVKKGKKKNKRQAYKR